VLATFVAGLAWALTLRARRPEVFTSIGRTVFEEAYERD
jgi:hypothetical protein